MPRTWSMQSLRLKRQPTVQRCQAGSPGSSEPPSPSTLWGNFRAAERAALRHGWFRIAGLKSEDRNPKEARNPRSEPGTAPARSPLIASSSFRPFLWIRSSAFGFGAPRGGFWVIYPLYAPCIPPVQYARCPAGISPEVGFLTVAPANATGPSYRNGKTTAGARGTEGEGEAGKCSGGGQARLEQRHSCAVTPPWFQGSSRIA